MKEWFKKGEHWIWFSASAVSISVVLVIGLILMISYRGLVHFWPSPVYTFDVNNNGQIETIVGEVHRQTVKEIVIKTEDGQLIRKETPRYLMKIGNRDIHGIDFRWVDAVDIVNQQKQIASNVVVIERYRWGNVYGYFDTLTHDGKTLKIDDSNMDLVNKLLGSSNKIHYDISYIEKITLGTISHKLAKMRLEQRKLEFDGGFTEKIANEFILERARLEEQFVKGQKELAVLRKQKSDLGEITLTIADGRSIHVPIKNIVEFWQPNEMSLLAETGFFFRSIGGFLSEHPREANTEGGVFPAIVGTITMVMLMAIFVLPMGVIAAIYMSEYAREGLMLRIARISINNLAGVPSIVFGIFGLGFFVYILGGSIDQVFFEHSLPTPTFGTPALLWASLTIALLTLPLVIVSTQEGLSRVPIALREGSLSLGATKSETIMKVVLPMSMPAIMTGLILAVARAAGEVAPLMLVGVVKLAPALPVDFNAPFIHLDRQFMHLGFHIFDVGFQSPNVEAVQPLVYATSLLLITIILSLNLGAIIIRNRLREKYKSLSH